MLKKSLSLLVLFLLFSCNKEPSFILTPESFTEKDLSICENEPCSTVVIDYPKANGKGHLSSQFNEQIEQWVAQVLFLGDDGTPASKTIESAAKDFILAYRDYQADLPTTLGADGYEAEVNIEVSHKSDELISLVMDYFLYTGGAHGYGAVTFLNLNGKTGKDIQVEDLFSNVESVTKIAEQEFRKQYEIAPDSNINEGGFWFENDAFHLSETVGFADNYLFLTYNPYEIAPYSEGIISLKVPLERIDEFLNFEL
ncbi:MAG: DUF3298 and DUF4163 domain-containing protein [Flavobacteriaceae bacterium]|nr:DUF3298 and DUF4163 domain-containing protein [Flavobacteriaceae bacterium]